MNIIPFPSQVADSESTMTEGDIAVLGDILSFDDFDFTPDEAA